MSALYSGLTAFLPMTKCSAPGLPRVIGAPFDEVKPKPGIVSVCRIAATTADAGGLACGESIRTPAPMDVFVPQLRFPGRVIRSTPAFQSNATQPAFESASSICVANPSDSGSASTLMSNVVPANSAAAFATASTSIVRGVVSSANLSDRRRLSPRSCSDSNPSLAISMFAAAVFEAASTLYVSRARSFWSEIRALKRYWARPATTVKLVAIAAIIPKPKYALSAQTSHFSGDIFTPYDIVLVVVIIVCGFCVAGCAAFALHDVNRRERARLTARQSNASVAPGPEQREGGEV